MPDAHVANAGVANGKAFERSFLGGPRAAWGSQNPEGEWPCRARGAAPPREAWFPYSACVAREIYWEGVAGGNGPLRWVAQDAGRPEAREETSSLPSAKKEFLEMEKKN